MQVVGPIPVKRLRESRGGLGARGGAAPCPTNLYLLLNYIKDFGFMFSVMVFTRLSANLNDTAGVDFQRVA